VAGAGRTSGGQQHGRPSRLGAQRRALAAACRRRGWQLPEVGGAGRSAKDGKRSASDQPVDRADDTTLLASKQERLDRALLELAALLASARKQGWALTALDCTVKTTPVGEAIANMRVSFATRDQQLTSQRTRAALARARARGVRLGRPPTMRAHVIERIKRERAAGRSLATIANGLNADRVPTAQGGRRWYPATVRYTLNRTR